MEVEPLGPGSGVATGVGPNALDDLVRVEDGRCRLHYRRHHLEVGGVDVHGRDLDRVVGVDDWPLWTWGT